MLQTSDWIYLDLEKTGCTFLRNKLINLCSNQEFINTDKHSLQTKIFNIPKIITIRDPKSYYFSLWSYGLDKRGGIYDLIRIYYPEKLEKFYINNSKDCFSYFLDFMLSFSERYPKSIYNLSLIKRFAFFKTYLKLMQLRTKIINTFKVSELNKNLILLEELSQKIINRVIDSQSWLPCSCDIYTARILSMLIPLSETKSFSELLANDLSYDNLSKLLTQYMPEIIIRTSDLNNDFYLYAESGSLDFLKLANDWKDHLEIDSKPINTSTLSLGINNNDNYFSKYHEDLIRTKCQTALLLIKTAKDKLEHLKDKE